MKREQKAFVMLMAACMAFTGISSLMRPPPRRSR